jgi:uncharacterized protein with NRDE domain
MCLSVIALDQQRRFPLVLCVNRDEFFSRPTARLSWWKPEGAGPEILGGRDLDVGGTWLGLTKAGRLGLVTNIRSRTPPEPDAPSRGEIVTRWLFEQPPVDRFWTRIAMSGYNGFNLIMADFAQGECYWASSTLAMPRRLDRGLYGLSNAALDTPWPKLVAAKQRLAQHIREADSADDLASLMFEAMADRTVYPDDQLPRTGVAPELERALSAAFVHTANGSYGTRSTTLIIAERVNKRLVTQVYERTFTAKPGGVALMRRVTLKNWPPRHTEGLPSGDVESSTVDEASMDSLPVEPAKRKRARGVIKPLTKSRSKSTVFGDLGG